ncbi:MAG: carbohydrate kinase [Bacillota bacterium]
MPHHVEVVCLGEAVVDMVSLRAGATIKDSPGFLKAPGGAPANVAVMLSRLGHGARFVGKVGRDPFGQFLQDALEMEGVDTSHLIKTEDARTTLAFVSLSNSGERDFLFYRNPGADLLLDEIEVGQACLEGARILHLGSVSLASNPSRTATLRCLRDAQALGLTVTFDPNLRHDLWVAEAEARRWTMRAVAGVEVLKLATDEAMFLSGEHSVEDAAAWLIHQGPGLVVVTLGEQGCYYARQDASGWIMPYPTNPVDTTGAGDAFMGALIARLLEAQVHPRELMPSQIEDILSFCNAAGALAVSRRGAVPSLPSREEVEALVAQAAGPGL